MTTSLVLAFVGSILLVASAASLLLLVIIVVVLARVVSGNIAGHAISVFIARRISIEGVIVRLLTLFSPFVLPFLVVFALPLVIPFVAFAHIGLLLFLARWSLTFRHNHELLLTPLGRICRWLRLLFGLFLAVLKPVVAAIILFLLIPLVSILLILPRLLLISIVILSLVLRFFFLCEGLKRCRPKTHRRRLERGDHLLLLVHLLILPFIQIILRIPSFLLHVVIL